MKKGAYPAPEGSMPSIEWIHIERLKVDETYQRSTENKTSQKLIGDIANRFDWRLCAPLVVSRRPDGALVIIDGQHRWWGAVRRADIPQLPCCVFSYSGPAEEAAMFIRANRARKAMNRLDDFHAAIAAGDAEALVVEKLIADAGLKVARSTAASGWGIEEVAFTSSILRAVRKYGAEVAALALANLAEAFPNEVLTYGGALFSAQVEILGKPFPGFEPDRLFQALLAFDMKGWGTFMEGLKGGTTRASGMKQMLLEAYRDLRSPEAAVADAVERQLQAA